MSALKEQQDDKIIRLEATDSLFPRAWVAGSMKYEHFQPLAEGGSASLQTCFDKNLKRTVVFKKLHPHLRNSDIETMRFLREARVTGMIAHPGTVPLYELGRDSSGDLYFTMKYITGRDLRSILMDLAAYKLGSREEFPLTRLIDILIAASQTVAYAHTQGVIHRDLKPANIIVGPFGEVTVLDWGLAKVAGEQETLVDEVAIGKKAVALELTQPGKRYGTPLYMSPEQASADPKLDQRADVYNLGSILFEMLTLKNLVWGNDVDEVIEQILNQPAPKPSTVSPNQQIPAELEAICLKALAKNPDERYQSVEAMIDDLIRYRNNEEVSAYHYRPLEHWVRWRTRHALTLTAAVAFVLGGAAVGLLGLLLFGL
ncbi:MAG: serine/threonine protein kinase [Trueperaceae bacterium]|nr:serine/threonine protein kinase [Trueperaceae bacterium]